MPGPNEDQPQQGELPDVDMAPQSPGAERDAIARQVEPLPAPTTGYHVKLEGFEGPLDLLLHLIRKHELDILDIPISFITQKYLEYIKMMEELSIDVASEYLVMAATLAHIKSKMLLPPDPNAADDEDIDLDELDPRTDLVRRLLEYQKYKHVAAQLGGRDRRGRDLFERGTNEPVPQEPAPLASVSVFRLFDAFEKVLERADQQADHQVLFERVSIAERVVEITEMLADRRRMLFDELFAGDDAPPTRAEMVLTFLAVLEMCKMRVIRVGQDAPTGDGQLGGIHVEFAPKRIDGDAVPAPPADQIETDEQDSKDETGQSEEEPGGEASGQAEEEERQQDQRQEAEQAEQRRDPETNSDVP